MLSEPFSLLPSHESFHFDHQQSEMNLPFCDCICPHEHSLVDLLHTLDSFDLVAEDSTSDEGSMIDESSITSIGNVTPVNFLESSRVFENEVLEIQFGRKMQRCE
jgi:hypothetical protein